MGFRDWFKRRRGRAQPRDLGALIEAVARPALHLVRREPGAPDKASDDAVASRRSDAASSVRGHEGAPDDATTRRQGAPGQGSYLGGRPLADRGLIWPTRDGRALGFIGQLDLAGLGAGKPAWLPRAGVLQFFYDTDEQPWGFDPQDRGGWRVRYQPPGSTLAEVPPPSGAPASLTQIPVLASTIRTLPTWERAELPTEALSDAELDRLDEIQDAVYGDLPAHQVGGYPAPIQGDTMELECQLASHGFNVGDPSGFESPGARAVSAGASDWRLLLQVDIDESWAMEWGDGGRLYFWVREADARAAMFDDVWLILQCH